MPYRINTKVSTCTYPVYVVEIAIKLPETTQKTTQKCSKT